MRLDVDFVATACDHCGHSPYLEGENITYNVAPIYYPTMRAIGVRGGLRGLTGMRVADVRVDDALAFLDRHEARLRERAPDNAGGSIRCVRRVLRAIERVAREAPDAVIEVM